MEGHNNTMPSKELLDAYEALIEKCEGLETRNRWLENRVRQLEYEARLEEPKEYFRINKKFPH